MTRKSTAKVSTADAVVHHASIDEWRAGVPREDLDMRHSTGDPEPVDVTEEDDTRDETDTTTED